MLAEIGYCAYCFDLCGGSVLNKGKMMFAKFDPQNVPEIVNCGPMKLGRCYVKDVINLDPITEIKTYTGPVLIAHGIYGCFRNQQLGDQFFDTIFLIRTYVEANNWNTAGSHKQYYDKADVSEYFR